jgi:phospholipid transport system substrate-binding protein
MFPFSRTDIVSATRKMQPMKRACTIVILTLLVLGSSVRDPLHSATVTPAGQLRQTWEQIVVLIQSARFNSESGIDDFKVTEVVAPRFDFAEMAQHCLGDHWENRSREERDEFVQLFTDNLSRAYVDNIRTYENARIVFTRETSDADSAEVDTKIVTDGAKDLLVNYKLRFVDTDWKIYDVFVDDVSLITNLRSQFHRIIARSSFAELLRIMKGKQR